MERLTEWDADGNLLVREEERLLNCNGRISHDEMYKIMRHLAEKLVKYEDLEEQGKLRILKENGRPKNYTKEQINSALELLETHSYNKVSNITGISKSTLIRAMRKRKLNM